MPRTVDGLSAAPVWIRRLDHVVRLAIMWVACILLVLMVSFTIYTVVMRYVFRNPPFWGDTVSLFCNIWLVLIAYALAVRDREDIATEGIYGYFSTRTVALFRFSWQILTLALGVFLIWFGFEAALTVPGRFWELGGLPKMFPMLALPVCGVLVSFATAMNVAEDVLRWRAR
jgi:TRAP-type C4-dicarboxylate transport system permease small subunit